MPPVTLSHGTGAQSVPGLFLLQLSWLIHGGLAAKRVFTRWLLELPAPPRPGTVLILSQARQIAARHVAQLEQLVEVGAAESDDPVPCRGISTLLEEAEKVFGGGRPQPQFFAVLHQLESGFATACGSAAETAMVLNRVDLAAVLASWAAACRGLQEEIQAQHPQAA